MEKTKKNNAAESDTALNATIRKLSDDVEKTRTVTFVASTDSRDRHGTVLNQKNWDIDNFNRNPVIGYQHNVYGGNECNEPNPDSQLGVGKAYFETTKKASKDEKTELLIDVTFEPAELNPLAEKVFQKILHGSLRASSVGFIPLKDDKGNKGTYGKQNEDGEITDSDTYFFVGQELLELSIVNIPSNPDALKKSFRNDTSKALTFLTKALNMRYAEIEDLKVRDILDILDGRAEVKDVLETPETEEIVEEKKVEEKVEDKKDDNNLYNEEKELLLTEGKVRRLKLLQETN